MFVINLEINGNVKYRMEKNAVQVLKRLCIPSDSYPDRVQ